MGTVKACFYLMLHFFNLNVGNANDELYKKFYQTDCKVNFERQSVTEFNKSFGEFTLSTNKYNRTHFGTNSTLYLNIDLGNDLEDLKMVYIYCDQNHLHLNVEKCTIIVQAYKFLSNEYRTFPIHFEYNFCKGFKNNFVGIKSCSENCGNLSCPLKKNFQYFICNCLSDESKLPPLIPTGSFKLTLEGRHKNDLVGRAEIYGTVYRPIVPGKRFG